MEDGEAFEEETIINLGRSLTNNIDLEGNCQIGQWAIALDNSTFKYE